MIGISVATSYNYDDDYYFGYYCNCYGGIVGDERLYGDVRNTSLWVRIRVFGLGLRDKKMLYWECVVSSFGWFPDFSKGGEQ